MFFHLQTSVYAQVTRISWTYINMSNFIIIINSVYSPRHICDKDLENKNRKRNKYFKQNEFKKKNKNKK